MSVTASTLAADRARTRKALALTAALRAAGGTVADLATIDWALTARVAGVNPPSLATQQMVLAMLTVSEGATPADPFRGL